MELLNRTISEVDLIGSTLELSGYAFPDVSDPLWRIFSIHACSKHLSHHTLVGICRCVDAVIGEYEPETQFVLIAVFVLGGDLVSGGMAFRYHGSSFPERMKRCLRAAVLYYRCRFLHFQYQHLRSTFPSPFLKLLLSFGCGKDGELE